MMSNWDSFTRQSTSGDAEWDGAASSFARLEACIDQLKSFPRAPKIYVQDMGSPQWEAVRANLMFAAQKHSDTPHSYRGFLGMAIVEAPILAWGDMPPGIYGCGGNYFVIGGKLQEGRDDG